MCRTADRQPIDGTPLVLGEENGDFLKLGRDYFKWLRRSVESMCHRAGLDGLDGQRVRITRPALSGAGRADMLLVEMLEEAGWEMHTAARTRTLAEPLANAVGVFSDGRDSVLRNRGAPASHDPGMFQGSGLLAQMRLRLLGGGDSEPHAQIVDVGGFTTDCGLLTFQLDALYETLEGYDSSQVRHQSFPMGVADLDRMVLDAFDSQSRDQLGELFNDARQTRLEDFHGKVYGIGHDLDGRNDSAWSEAGENGLYSLKRRRIGKGADAHAVRERFEQFGRQVADEVSGFLGGHDDAIHDLILTGGGMRIPEVRRAVACELRPFGVRTTHMYWASVRPGQSEHEDWGDDTDAASRHRRLDRNLLRGATALGGASVCFDFVD